MGKPNQANALKGNPIYFANDIVVSQAELDIDLVKDYTILRCPESFNKFKHIGSQGAIIVLTKQEFETTTPNKIIQEKKLDGAVIFAINSLFLPDLSLKISLKAIDEIETTFVIDPITKKEKPCINIWTIPKANREKYFTELF